jgi:hypothetical protein
MLKYHMLASHISRGQMSTKYVIITVDGIFHQRTSIRRAVLTFKVNVKQTKVSKIWFGTCRETVSKGLDRFWTIKKVGKKGHLGNASGYLRCVISVHLKHYHSCDLGNWKKQWWQRDTNCCWMHFGLQASEEVIELHSTEAYWWWWYNDNGDGDKSILFQTNYMEF